MLSHAAVLYCRKYTDRGRRMAYTVITVDDARTSITITLVRLNATKSWYYRQKNYKTVIESCPWHTVVYAVQRTIEWKHARILHIMFVIKSTATSESNSKIKPFLREGHSNTETVMPTECIQRGNVKSQSLSLDAQDRINRANHLVVEQKIPLQTETVAAAWDKRKELSNKRQVLR